MSETHVVAPQHPNDFPAAVQLHKEALVEVLCGEMISVSESWGVEGWVWVGWVETREGGWGRLLF